MILTGRGAVNEFAQKCRLCCKKCKYYSVSTFFMCKNLTKCSVCNYLYTVRVSDAK